MKGSGSPRTDSSTPARNQVRGRPEFEPESLHEDKRKSLELFIKEVVPAFQ